jgi:hypothetical protein
MCWSAGAGSQMRMMGSGTQPMHVLRPDSVTPVQGRPLEAKAGRTGCGLHIVRVGAGKMGRCITPPDLV